MGTTSCLHRAVGLPGQAGDPPVPVPLEDTHSVLSLLLTCHLRLTTRTSGSHSNWEEVYRVTSRLEMPHRDAHLFFPTQEPRACHGRSGKQGESKGRCRLVRCVLTLATPHYRLWVLKSYLSSEKLDKLMD